MHTCEHIINQTMIRLFGCGRSVSAHIERKKSKLDYRLEQQPTEEDVKRLEDAVNEVIGRHLDVTTDFITQEEARGRFDLQRLPDDASQTVRLRRMPLHRYARGQHGRNRYLPHHQPRLGRSGEALAHPFQTRQPGITPYARIRFRWEERVSHRRKRPLPLKGTTVTMQGERLFPLKGTSVSPYRKRAFHIQDTSK